MGDCGASYSNSQAIGFVWRVDVDGCGVGVGVVLLLQSVVIFCVLVGWWH